MLDVATKQDLAQVFALEQQVFGEHSYPDFFFRQAFDCWHDGLMVAKNCQGKILGYQLAVRGSDPKDYWILSLAVATESQGQGVGKQLIKAGIRKAPSGVERVLLTVSPTNSARQLYQAQGFADIAFDAEYFGPNQPRIVMALALSA
ncbi:GNAT family N-acetyltransferase [Shewanella sp. NIFS-20-20]|nr:GNAT family N-acetyltransferase [Shewanella sp. NIFS-20-20]